MADDKAYWKKLQDPRWQKKRLEILERDGFACVNCGSERQTLHVHHSYYAKGVDPWDADGEHLRTLCESCHELFSRERDKLNIAIAAIYDHDVWLRLTAFVEELARLTPQSQCEVTYALAALAHEYFLSENGEIFSPRLSVVPIPEVDPFSSQET